MFLHQAHIRAWQIIYRKCKNGNTYQVIIRKKSDNELTACKNRRKTKPYDSLINSFLLKRQLFVFANYISHYRTSFGFCELNAGRCRRKKQFSQRRINFYIKSALNKSLPFSRIFANFSSLSSMIGKISFVFFAAILE